MKKCNKIKDKDKVYDCLVGNKDGVRPAKTNLHILGNDGQIIDRYNSDLKTDIK